MSVACKQEEVYFGLDGRLFVEWKTQAFFMDLLVRFLLELAAELVLADFELKIGDDKQVLYS